MPAPALRPRAARANFQGKHFRLENALNFPKPLQPRVPI
jgi:alkanesulfonate monooxygenase SsuD/methylene tetrahydromethanopterin reductase-like flavin-dependent oxidoreductase (luciferase family)